ncbi:MAG: glycosyltransferase family 4 protein [Alphaproteobacteria bacterium]|nr:glycosyltransferase family 4 protein [Alphaproteobacteria bacterium]
MNKKKLLFDASALYLGCLGQGTGIYNVALNLLNQFHLSGCFDITLWASSEKKYPIQLHLKNVLGVEFPFDGKKISFVEKKLGNLLVKRKKEKKKSKFVFFVRGLLVKFFKMCLLLEKSESKKISETYDVAFSPANAFDKSISASKKIIFLHDVIPFVLPEYAAGLAKGEWFGDLVESLNDKDIYIANSQYTKNDFLKYSKVVNEKQISVALLAANKDFYYEKDAEKIKIALKKYNIPTDKKYIFSLCTLEPRKNLMRILTTFIKFIDENKINDLYFVLGGGSAKKVVENLIAHFPEAEQFKDKIICAGYVDSSDLALLYSGAVWTVYTTQYEGFGLPALEAMQCGCPVITANNTSLPEVVGDAAIMIDWDSDEQHIQAYKKFYFDEKNRESYKSKGLEQSKLFSWEKTAKVIIDKMIG